MPYYLNVNIDGLIIAQSNGDGYSITLRWATAYPTNRSYKILYNIYMNDGIAPPNTDMFFNQSPAFVSFDGSTSVQIIDLVPGTLYHFAIRAAEYDPSFFNPTTLPQAYNGLGVLPYSLLENNITATSSLIPLVDAYGFPATGTVKIGGELVNYSSIDINNNLVLINPSIQRGFNNSIATIYNTDGYDGYVYWDPNVIFWPVELEDQNTVVYECWNRFDIEHFPFTITDGYRQKTKDILTIDATCSDAMNTPLAENTSSFLFSGYRRTSPALLLSGACIGSYIGGQIGCADGYNGVGLQLRGLNAQQANIAIQSSIILATTGEPVCLVQRRWTGITCKCMLPYNEYPEARCNICFGTGIVVGWIQYFNPARSDGKIMVRLDPSVDDLIAMDSGLESTMQPNVWTIPVPTIKDRDFIVRFDDCGNEEFRYEVLNVTRNKLFLDGTGAQKFAMQRIRKTDPIYQVRITYDTSDFPSTIPTSVSSSIGIQPHFHTLVINENVTSISQINQLTSVAAGHNHVIENGVVLTERLHTHTITL
jgi:hypothetical protein